MRITRVRLVDFRGVADSVVEFGPGVTVVEGPNEVGKSSIAEAVRLVRDYKATSSNKDIRSIQPVGRDVGPEVVLTLTTGPYELEYRKRWLKRPVTELHVRAPKPEELSGDSAHDRFRAILEETLDLDLLVALEVQQGQSLAQADLARIPALRRTLGSSGEQGSDHDALMEAVESEFLRYFTAGGRPTGEFRRAQEELGSAQDELRSLERSSAELDGFVDRRAHLGTVVDDLVGRLAEAREDLKVRESDARHLEERTQAVTALARAVADARIRCDRAQEAVDRRHSLTAAVGTRIGDVRDAAERLEVLEARRDAAEKDFHEAEARAAACREAEAAAREASRRASDALARRREEQELADLRDRVVRARAARERLRAARSELDVATVDQDTVETLVGLDNAVLVAQRTRDAAAALVTVRSLGDQQVLVDGVALVGGTERSTRVHDSLGIEVPGIARVEITAGETPGELDRGLSDARAELSEALSTAGVSTIGQARDIARRRSAAEAEVGRATEDLGNALGDDDLEAVEQRLSDLTARLGDPEGTGGDTEATTAEPPSSTEELKAGAESARAAEEEAAAALAAAGKALDRARDARDAEAGKVLVASTEVESARRELTRLQEDLEAERARADDATLRGELEEATRERDLRQGEADAARAALEATDPDTVALLLDNARRLVDSTDADLRSTREEITGLETLIDDRLSRGIGSAHEEAAARVEVATATCGRLARDAAAARLLRETMVRQRDLAQQRYVAPFTERIEQLGRVVFGRDFRVGITPELAIESRTLGGRTVPFSSLSAGAREQLALIGRLACAQLVAADEGAPVILDDTLGFSDPARLRSVAAVLGAVGSTTQVIVLTCQPERFAGIGGAGVVRLERAPDRVDED